MKARSTLMMGIPNKHHLKFNSIKDAKKLLEAVESFGGNAATRKTQRNLLKQQYENFTASSSEMLDQTFDRLQKLVRQLELLDEKLSQEDVNQKLLRKEMDLRWQMAMLTMTVRRLLKNTERKLTVTGNETIGFDKSKWRCYKCHMEGTAHEGPNYALMAFSSSSPDSEVIRTDEFVNEPVVENCKAMSREEEPKVVRKYDDAPSIEEWVSDDEEKDVAQPKTEKENMDAQWHMTERPITYYEKIDEDRCPVTILNTIDHLGKFDSKADKGVYESNNLKLVGSGPDWLFDIDALTRTMNYEPIVVGTQSNGFAGTKASDNAGQARKETEPVKDYILLPLWTADPPYSQDPKSSHDDGSKPSSDDGKKVDEDPRKDSECKDQEKEYNVNNTNNVNNACNVNIVSLTINYAGTNEVNAVGRKTSLELPLITIPALEYD
ncbi:hypothetical protein Tco_0569807 [Tanacetum coccineum]